VTRALHLTRDFPPRVNGGISVAVGGAVRACRAAGMQIAVISFDGWRPKGKPAAGLPSTDDVCRVTGPGDLPEAQRFAERFAPDVVHVHAGMLWDAVTLPRVPRVLSVHVAQETLRRMRGLESPTKSEAAQAAAIAAADRVVVPSRAVLRSLAPPPGLPLGGGEGSARLVPWGVDPAERADGGQDLLYVGRLADIKGTAELFDAMRRVDATLHVAGGLPDSARAEKKWRERAPSNVSFQGWLDRDALEDRYRSAAMLIAPSWHETFGLAVAEAMAHGVPVIAADAGALPERVTHERSGLLVPPRDVDALVAAIERLRNDDALRDRLAEGARDAAQAWTWEACAAGLSRVYAELER